MDIESLKELEYKNMELNKKIYQRNNKADDILDFYPMFKLKEPYTSYYSDTFNRLKPYQLLPFFENIIFSAIVAVIYFFTKCRYSPISPSYF